MEIVLQKKKKEIKGMGKMSKAALSANFGAGSSTMGIESVIRLIIFVFVVYFYSLRDPVH